MPVADDYHRVRPGLFLWQAWCPSNRVDLSCTAVVATPGLVLIDPIRLAEPAWEELTAQHGPPVLILLTNGNHERDSHWFAARHGCPVLAHPDALPELVHPAQGSLRENSEPFCGCAIIELPGAGPGEIAVHLEERGILILGDIVIHLENHGFSLLPDKYAVHPKQMRTSARRLAGLAVDLLTFAHGAPITMRARERLGVLVAG